MNYEIKYDTEHFVITHGIWKQNEKLAHFMMFSFFHFEFNKEFDFDRAWAFFCCKKSAEVNVTEL